MLLKGVGRAFGGAVLFALPLLMTMEIWRLGVSIPRWRLALLVVATVALAVVLSHYFGSVHEENVGLVGATVDAGVAVLVGLVAAAVVLTILSVARPLDDWRDAVSVVAIETLPATIGASFARSQLGEDTSSSDSDQRGRLHEAVIVMQAPRCSRPTSRRPRRWCCWPRR